MRLSKTVKAAGLALALAAVSAGAAAAKAAPADCPLARTPYSSQTPLIDLMLDPRAAAVLDAQGLVKSVPERMRGTTPPTFAAIITPRKILAGKGPAAMDALDRELAAIPITDE